MLLIPQWFRLPLDVRQRWWSETDYGRLDPTPELVTFIQAELEKIKLDAEQEGLA
jgi:hypothetical protein